MVTQGAHEIVQSYKLFRRTLNKPDLLGPGSLAFAHGIPGGPLRLPARPLDPQRRRPRLDPYRDLMQQLAQLNPEKEILSL